MNFHPEEIVQIRKSHDPGMTFLNISVARRTASSLTLSSVSSGTSAVTSAVTSTTTSGTTPALGGLRSRLLNLKAETPCGNTTTPTGPGLRERLQNNQSVDSETKRTIYVENLPTYYEDEDVRDLVNHMNVSRVNILRRESNGIRVSTGNAFVVCRTVDETQKCLAYLDGLLTGNSKLKAQMSRPKR
jgi:hypothetical protein